ncbi:TfoX/Sxy family protein [Microbacterium sp. 179-I 3D4 NHS]|uniref:TfoX/Sxy family protein n=1 Tax=Microbacterium sp. 179-I 3D4 NHS TaxID=3142381 RepID=UPI0039A035CB
MDAAAEELADRLRALLTMGDGVEERRMFGTRAFLAEGRILAAARRGGVLLVRVPPGEEEALLARRGVSRAVMGRQTMSARWLDVAAEIIADDEQLMFWLDAGRAGSA